MHGSVAVEDARSLTTGARSRGLSGYLISDARGSILATTGFDSGSPGLTQETEYDAWGKRLAGYSAMSAPRHGFAGAEPDEAVGTYSFGARTYDPTLRRWVSPDPLLMAAPHIDEHVGDSLNLYAYGDGNPVKNTDKSGFCPTCEGVAAGAIVGGFVEAIRFAATAPTNLSAREFALGAARSFSNGAWEGAAAGAVLLVGEVAIGKGIQLTARAVSTETAAAKTVQGAAKADGCRSSPAACNDVNS